MWECQEVQTLLQRLEIFLDALSIPFSFNKETFLLGLIPLNKLNLIDNEIIILIKQYIYRTRCQQENLSLPALVKTIKDYFSVQKYIASTKGDLFSKKLEDNWKKWEKVIDINNT